MKVIFVTTESLMDHSYTMACELKKTADMKVIITAKKLTPEISEFCRKLDAVFIKRVRFINPLSFLKEIKLMFFIRKQNADVVWFNAFSLYQSMLAKLFVKQIVVNAHDIELHPEESDYHGIMSQKITFRFYKKHIAVMSKTQQEIFKGKYGFTPALLQLPRIDYYEASAEKTKPAREPLNAKSRIRFFFFGTVLVYKGIERLLDAAEILEKKGHSFEVNIYGRLKYNRDEIKRKAEGIKSVKLTDEFIDYREVYNIYNENDALVIPYIHVSQCGPLLIGYNQNIPVICSDLPGFREYVDDGKSGLLFGNTAEELAEKMEEIIKNPKMLNEISGFVMKDSKENFSRKSLMKSYMAVLEKAAKY